MSLDANGPRLTAYVLGELDPRERTEIDRELESSPLARQAVEELREITSVLSEELKKEPATRLSQFQRIAIESESQRHRGPARRIPWLGLAVAATILVAIGAYVHFQNKPNEQLAKTNVSPKQNDESQSTPVQVNKATRKPSPNKSNRRQADDAGGEPNTAMSSDKLATDSTSNTETPAKAADERTPAEPEPTKVASNTPPSIRPNSVKLASVDNVNWINERVTQLWEENNIKPSAAASDGEFIRRAYLDIVGTVPEPEVAAAYIKNRDKDKKAKLILSLVNSEDYTKYWAGIWNNLLVGRRPPRNRNVDKEALDKFLRDSFSENKPWNQIVFELVTATGGSTKESLKAGVPFNGATNFLIAHMNDGNVPATAFTTRLFLGVQVQCTQCHDHPFNDRTQEAFWGINAFFQRIRRQEHNQVDDTGRRRFQFAELTERPVHPGDDVFVRFDKRNAMVAVIPPRLLNGQMVEPREGELKLREELARFIIDRENDLFSQAIVNRMWSHFMGRGIVHPADDLGSHNPASNPDLLTRLAENFRESNYDLKRLISWITTSMPYSLSSQTNSTNKDDDQYFSHYPLKQMSPEQFFDSLIVASQANKVGSKASWEKADKMKEELQNQFTAVFNNDENTEADTFNGTIPQALLLMNGNIMQKAISKEKGSYLHERVEAVQNKVRGADVALLNDLYLAAVSRFPTPKERQLALLAINDTMAKSKDKDWAVEAFQDIFWALLNSSEFVLNH